MKVFSFLYHIRTSIIITLICIISLFTVLNVFGYDSLLIGQVTQKLIPSIQKVETVTEKQPSLDYVKELQSLDERMKNIYIYYSENRDRECESQIRSFTSENLNTSYNINYSLWVKGDQKLRNLINCNIYNSTVTTITIEIDYSDLNKTIDLDFVKWITKYQAQKYKITLLVKVSDTSVYKNSVNIVKWSGLNLTDLVFVNTISEKQSKQQLQVLKNTMVGIKQWYGQYYSSVKLSFSIDSKYSSLDSYPTSKLENLDSWVSLFLSEKVPDKIILGVSTLGPTDQYIMIRDDITPLLSDNITQNLINYINEYIKKGYNKEINLYFDFNISKSLVDKIDWVYLQQQVLQNQNIKLIIPNSQGLFTQVSTELQTDYNKQVEILLKQFPNIEQRDIQFLVYKYKSLYLESQLTTKK